jgi:hypothetical protein
LFILLRSTIRAAGAGNSIAAEMRRAELTGTGGAGRICQLDDFLYLGTVFGLMMGRLYPVDKAHIPGVLIQRLVFINDVSGATIFNSLYLSFYSFHLAVLV